MTCWINAPLRLAKDPELKTSKNGNAFCTGFGFVDTGDKGTPMNLITFGETLAKELARYRKGDRVLVAGELCENTYINRDGEEITQLQIIVKSLCGHKRQSAIQDEIKPRKRNNGGNNSDTYQQQRDLQQAHYQVQEPVDPDFDDDIEF